MCSTVKMWKCFLKFNDDNIYIDSLKDYNYLQISEQIINRRKLNNKRKALNVIYVYLYKMYPGSQFTSKIEMGCNLQRLPPLYISTIVINDR